MKRIAFWALHYGKEYLPWSVRAVQDSVDELHAIYVDRPSFGHVTQRPCPETELELQDAFSKFAKKPIFWHRGRFHNEGEHRDQIFDIARRFAIDQVIVVDADEIVDSRTASAMLDEAASRVERSFRVRFLHFWRSIKWVCRDVSTPVRIWNVHQPPLEGEIRNQIAPYYHFGYAQSVELMRYKWEIHGHLPELRPGWLENKFIAWKPGDLDVHPTCGPGPACPKGFWCPELVDPGTWADLRPLLGDHPYFNLEVIP